MSGPRTYTLLGADGKPYQSGSKGQLGGHRRTRIYGRLDCPAALRAIARGGYGRYRVFFADEPTAIAVVRPGRTVVLQTEAAPLVLNAGPICYRGGERHCGPGEIVTLPASEIERLKRAGFLEPAT